MAGYLAFPSLLLQQVHRIHGLLGREGSRGGILRRGTLVQRIRSFTRSSIKTSETREAGGVKESGKAGS